MVQQIDNPLGLRLKQAQRLSKYAVVYRYPDAETKPLTIRQVDSAVRIAQKIYDELLLLSDTED
jgi:hypothetical protein